MFFVVQWVIPDLQSKEVLMIQVLVLVIWSESCNTTLTMLQIRLNKGSASDGGAGAKSLPVETVTVACPDHLVLADLPVAKGLGSATASARLKIVGRKSRRQLGERVHFCVRCDFPISIYGRLSPCEHAFCLDCARSYSICYLCDERIQKIQTIKMMEGIFICAAPHCLKSFLKKTEFESHVHESHADLLQPNLRKEETNDSESFATKQPAALESSARAPPKPVLPPSSNSQFNERDDRARHQQSRDPPHRPQMQSKPTPYHVSNSNQAPDPQAVDRSQGHQSFEVQTNVHSYNQYSDKQNQPFLHQPPSGVPMQMWPNQLLTPPPPFGAPPLYPFPYEVARPEATVVGSDPGSHPGFQPMPPVNIPGSFHHSWSAPSLTSAPYEAMQGVVHGKPDGMGNPSDPHARGASFYAGDYGRSLHDLPASSILPPVDTKGSLSSQPMLLPPPPQGPPPGYMMQQ
ncbi:hypothetical protein Drorol1_Dr00022251 [Drosera rotundifolia]